MQVTLAAIHTYTSPQAIPLANAYLKAYLTSDEELATTIAVSLCDLFVGHPLEESVAAILASKPAAVGLSLYAWNRQQALAITAELRRRSPAMTIFAGGPEATADPSGVLAAAPFDFLIVGEGERPFLECMARLAAGERLTGVKGIAFFADGKLCHSPREPVELLDTIPSPYLTGAIELRNYSGVLWELSRGCSFSCDFCFDFKGGKGVRRFSLERIEAELCHFARNRVTQVFVLDSTFNQELTRAKAILRMIKRLAPHIHFHFEVRSEFIDAELARLFSEIPCSLQIGLQSADAAVLKGLKRSFDPTDFRRKIALLNETGAIFGFDLIYGLPGETLQGFARSLDFALALAPNHLDIFPLAVLPGTPLAAKTASIGLNHLPAPPYTLTSSPTFPLADMQEAMKLAAACDIFYSRGKAVAWFNAVLQALQLKPADFLGGFQHWLEKEVAGELTESRFSDEEVWQLQRRFMTCIFKELRRPKLLPVALDHLDYNYHYAAALLAPEPELPTDRELANSDLLALRFSLSPSTRLAQFNFEIFDLLEAGTLDLKEFVACFKPTGSYAAIYPRAGEVFTEPLIEPYFRLLERLDGATPARELAERLAIPAEEAASFLEFATAEGIASFNCNGNYLKWSKLTG